VEYLRAWICSTNNFFEMNEEEKKQFIKDCEKYKDDLKNLGDLDVKMKGHVEKLDGLISKAGDQAKDAAETASQKVATELKDEIKKVAGDYKELSETLVTAQKHQDEIDVAVKKLGQEGSGGDRKATLKSLLYDMLGKDGMKEQLQSKKTFEEDFDLKVVGDMGTGTHLSGVSSPLVTDFQQFPGVIYDPARPVRVRDIMSVTPTSEGLIKWTRELGGEGGAAMVPEAVLKPQIDKDIERVSRPVEKIASYFRVPEEMIDDIPFLQTYLVQRGVDDLMNVEDTQLLIGTGVTPQLFGMLVEAAAYVDVLADASTQEFDVLAAAVTQIRNLHYNPTGILIHPSRFLQMLLIKDSQDRYLLPNVYTGVAPSIMGVPVLVNTAIDSDAFLVGDFRGGATLFQRKGVSVRFFDQDRDNAIQNMITIVIEERLANVVQRPNAFAASTGFDAAIIAGQS